MGLFRRCQPEPGHHAVGGVDVPILTETVSCNRCGQRGCRVLVVASGDVPQGVLLLSKCFRCGKCRHLIEDENRPLYSSARATYGTVNLPDCSKVVEYVFSIDSL